jgi:hypothetical protein
MAKAVERGDEKEKSEPDRWQQKGKKQRAKSSQSQWWQVAGAYVQCSKPGTGQ